MATAYRADHLGSFLRPPELLQARDAHAQGQLTLDELRNIEDSAILDVLELQREVGVEVFSDGEFRRGSFLTGFAEAVEGFGPASSAVSWEWHGPEGGMIRTTARPVESKLRQIRRLTAHESSFLKEHSSGPFKITIPSPTCPEGLRYGLIHPWWLGGNQDTFP